MWRYLSERTIRKLRLVVTAGLALFVIIALSVAPEPSEDRALKIGDQIRCPVCSGESIAASPNQLARDMMLRVRELIAAGYTDEQVIDEVIAGYTDAQRLDPAFRPATAALWTIPALVLTLGAVAGARTRRRTVMTDE